MTKAALQPIHHILAQDYITIIDKLYVSFNIEAEKHEYDLMLAIDTLKGLKSGKISIEQLEVTDDAWQVLDADMVQPSLPTEDITPELAKDVRNGRKSKKEAKDAVSTTSR